MEMLFAKGKLKSIELIGETLRIPLTGIPGWLAATKGKYHDTIPVNDVVAVFLESCGSGKFYLCYRWTDEKSGKTSNWLEPFDFGSDHRLEFVALLEAISRQQIDISLADMMKKVSFLLDRKDRKELSTSECLTEIRGLLESLCRCLAVDGRMARRSFSPGPLKPEIL